MDINISITPKYAKFSQKVSTFKSGLHPILIIRYFKYREYFFPWQNI
jgi:hypothetical protein